MPIAQTQTFEKLEGNSYPLIPKGIYTAELLDVEAVENETYDSKMGKTTSKQYQTDLKWQFTLLAGEDKSQSEEKLRNLRGRNIWENYGQSFLYAGKNGKNNLYRIVEAFIGRELTREEEASGISSEMLNSFIGKQILLSIEPKTSKAGKTFDNIIDYLTAQTQLTPLTPAEREKATVSKKERETADTATQSPNTPSAGTDGVAEGRENEYVNAEKLANEQPQEGQATHPQYKQEDDSINVGNIPFN